CAPGAPTATAAPAFASAAPNAPPTPPAPITAIRIVSSPAVIFRSWVVAALAQGLLQDRVWRERDLGSPAQHRVGEQRTAVGPHGKAAGTQTVADKQVVHARHQAEFRTV